MIYLPGSGIVAAYTDSATGQLSPEFDQALGLYYTAWCIVTFLFAVGACRASWVVVLILCFFDLECLLLAAGLMSGNAGVLKAGNGVGFVVAVLCCEFFFFFFFFLFAFLLLLLLLRLGDSWV